MEVLHPLLTCEDLLSEFNPDSVLTSRVIDFESDEGIDVYNITPPFDDTGGLVVAGRFEPRVSETSTTRFCSSSNETWAPTDRLKKLTYPLQDPFVSRIGGLLLLGGVEVTDDIYRTRFYLGENIANLAHILDGPDRMKDIRFIELEETVGIFTRPQGDIGGRGQIGFTEARDLASVTTELISRAPLVADGLFNPEEWGGVNQAHYLGEGNIGVLGHIARYQNESISDERDYYPFTLVYNHLTGQISNPKIIATRDCFPETDSKRPDLKNIIFPGGLVLDGTTATLYVGLSDAAAGSCIIENPFIENM